MSSDPDYALTILIASYYYNGIGLLVALMILVMYLQRLAIHHFPAREIIISTCPSMLTRPILTSTVLPLGPCGQGGYALVKGGDVARQLFPILAARDPTNERMAILAELGNAFYASGIVIGLLLFGLAFFFTVLAVCAGRGARNRMLTPQTPLPMGSQRAG